jgi:hypothetical protein
MSRRISNAIFVHNRRFRTETQDFRHHVLVEAKQIKVAYDDGSEALFQIPVGAPSDLASTPPIIWTKLGFEWLPPFGDYAPDCYAHDSAYNGSLEVWNGTDWVKAMLSKEDSDDLLFALMTGAGVNPLKAREIYDGVHIGGQKAFDEDRRNL